MEKSVSTIEEILHAVLKVENVEPSGDRQVPYTRLALQEPTLSSGVGDPYGEWKKVEEWLEKPLPKYLKWEDLEKLDKGTYVYNVKLNNLGLLMAIVKISKISVAISPEDENNTFIQGISSDEKFKDFFDNLHLEMVGKIYDSPMEHNN